MLQSPVDHLIDYILQVCLSHILFRLSLLTLNRILPPNSQLRVTKTSTRYAAVACTFLESKVFNALMLMQNGPPTSGHTSNTYRSKLMLMMEVWISYHPQLESS